MKGSSQQTAIVDYLFSHFKKAATLLPGSKPGFNHALKLSYQNMDKKRIISIGTPDDPQLVYRYQLSKPSENYSIGMWTALMDELSTDACFRVGLPSAAGLSLQIQTQLIDPPVAWEFMQTSDEVDVINRVAKLGKTISHTRTEFRCPQSQLLLAHSSQVKYMPSGNRGIDFALQYKSFYDTYVNYMVSKTPGPEYEIKPVKDVVSSSLQWESKSLGIFTVTNEHTNPFGVLHGGCAAMVLEMGALHFLTEKGCGELMVESIQLEYMNASPLSAQMKVVCDLVGTTSQDEFHVRAQLRMPGNDRVCVEAMLKVKSIPGSSN